MSQPAQIATFSPMRQRGFVQTQLKRRWTHLIPLLLVFYSFLVLTPEVELTVFGINFPSYRIALLAVSVPTYWTWLRGTSSRIQFMDVAIAIVGFWTLLSFAVIYGIEVGLVRGAAITIDTVLTYFVTRSCIRSLDDLRYFLILCLPGLGIAGVALAAESLSGQLIIRPAFAAVFGSQSAYVGGEASGSLELGAEYRLGGLLRAYGPFPHPILAGIMMIGLFPLYYFSGLRSWPWIGGIMLTLTGFFGLSSAAFLALILVLGGILINHVKAYVPKISWWTISGLLALLVWTAHMGSTGGIINVISRMTLSPETAQYRTHIWEWGIINVEKNPWFGIGYEQWERLAWMGESVDAHFLLLAMRHGLVVLIMLLIAIFYGIIRLGLIIPYLSSQDRAFCLGINISVISFLIVGLTVNYYGSSNILLMAVIAFLGSAVSWGNAQIQAQKHQRMLKFARAVVRVPANAMN